MISVEGAIFAAIALGALAAIQLWQDRQFRREQDDERRKASLTPAE